ncbi:MAG TPA: nitroreductase family protein [Candidatus Binatia bacterium]|jgi:F420 biosynthesis protein FbiB-like protein|nr:nitroreductase family protein [Candidatus Binatia bacterium]
MVDLPQFYEVLFGRRSIRRYDSAPVPSDALNRMLKAATWAPSAHNRQPWRFAVIEGEQTKKALANAMGAQLRRDLQADGVPPEAIEKDAGRSYARISSAPSLILICCSMSDMDQYPDPERQRNEWIMAVQSTAMAGQNLLLAAHAEGLGACWMCAPLFCPDVVREVLALPHDWQPQGLITLGYPAEKRTKSRASLDSRVLYANGTR